MRNCNIIIQRLSIFCRSKRKNPAFDEKMIRILSENPIYFRKTDLLPFYASSMFFVQGGNGKILLLEPKELEEIYYESHSFLNYKQFLRKALNQKLIIKAQDKGIAFELDREVTDNYINRSFQDFLNFYCVNSSKDNRLWLKGNLEEHQLFSIFYYFFINNYLTWFDDVVGTYYIFTTFVACK